MSVPEELSPVSIVAIGLNAKHKANLIAGVPYCYASEHSKVARKL